MTYDHLQRFPPCVCVCVCVLARWSVFSIPGDPLGEKHVGLKKRAFDALSWSIGV